MADRYDKDRARYIIDNTVDGKRRTKTCKRGATEKEAETLNLEMRAAMRYANKDLFNIAHVLEPSHV